MYRLHLEDGGNRSADVLKVEVSKMIDDWEKLPEFEYIELLVPWDCSTELDYLNKIFIDEHKKHFTRELYKQPFVRTDKLDVYGYRSLDYHRDANAVVNDKIYRYDNKIPYYQKNAAAAFRFYDRGNDGLDPRSRDLTNLGQERFGRNMTKLLQTVDEPYMQLDDHFLEYVCAEPYALGKNNLLSTNWVTGDTEPQIL